MKTLFKGLVALIISSVSSLIATKIPETKTEWLIFGITIVCSIVIYFAQRSIGLFTTTDKNLTDIFDFVSAAIIAVATAVSNGAATFVLDGTIAWAQIWAIASTTFVGFVIAKLKTNGNK